MSAFDWFRRSPAAKTTAEPAAEADPPKPETAGGVGTLVAERPSADAGGGAETHSGTASQPPDAGGESEGEQDMGFLDTIKEKLAPHHDKVDKGVDKAADMVEKKTGGKYGDKIDTGAEKAKETLGLSPEEAARGRENPPAPGAGPAGEAPPEQPPHP
ncbi:antitoxin [Yinghuangia sp. ASG 101]|uniref:antitoxin n=1 Tax=Yinghuangia sp. ASG 101 TaxID=2896848 RepID=UPI001E50FCFC|nr:antitoxin [Yinghuangia sp. ASG 101]UGQ13913.1 antitoxin [Yinghuangia sp. ASG 101]